MKRARARAPAKVQRAERMKGEREGSEAGSAVVLVEVFKEEVSSRGKRRRRSGDEEEGGSSEGFCSGGMVFARGCWRRKTAVTPRMRVEP